MGRIADRQVNDIIEKMREDADTVEHKLGFTSLAGRIKMVADAMEELRHDRDHWRYAAETAQMKLAKHEKALRDDL